jgi:hypothetical protein
MLKLAITLISLALLSSPALIPPAYAQDTVNLADEYAFGNIGSFGGLLHLIEPMVFVIASVAVVFYFAIGAFRWIVSGGDKSALEGARNMMTHAIIGFFMLILVFLLVQYLPSAIGLGDSFKIIGR